MSKSFELLEKLLKTSLHKELYWILFKAFFLTSHMKNSAHICSSNMTNINSYRKTHKFNKNIKPLQKKLLFPYFFILLPAVDKIYFLSHNLKVSHSRPYWIKHKKLKYNFIFLFHFQLPAFNYEKLWNNGNCLRSFSGGEKTFICSAIKIFSAVLHINSKRIKARLEFSLTRAW